MGSIRSIKKSFCVFGFDFAIKYARGYPIIRQITVAIKANAIERMKTFEYCERDVIFEKENPSLSVNAKYKTNNIGATMNITIQTRCGTAAIRCIRFFFFIPLPPLK
jgi:hypothetical protein